MTTTLHSVAVVYLPFLCLPTSSVLTALSREISKAEQSWHDLNRTLRNLKAADDDEDDGQQLCSHRSANPAPVYLVTSTIDLLNSGSGSARESSDDNLPLEERLDPKREFMVTSEREHWAISIRGITYEVLRKKGSRGIELKIYGLGSDHRADALGVRLETTSVRKIGVTFLSNEEIRGVAEAYRSVQDTLGLSSYDPVFNNCQSFWTLPLEKIICQCPDQEPLKPPRDHKGLLEYLTITNRAKAQLRGSILSLLHHHRIPPFRQILAFTPLSWPRVDLYVYLAAQLLTCYRIYAFATSKDGLWHDLRTGTYNVLSPWCDAVAAYHGKSAAELSIPELQEQLKCAHEPGSQLYETEAEMVADEVRARETAAAVACVEEREMRRETEGILCRHIYDLGRCYVFGGVIAGFCAFMYRVMGVEGFRYVELVVDVVLWMQFQHAVKITDGLTEVQPQHCRMLRTGLGGSGKDGMVEGDVD